MNRPTSRTSRLGLLVRHFRCGRRGAVAAEFAFVAPLLVVLTLGLIEMALAVLDFHRAGEATRRAIRAALINSPIAALDNLATTDIVCSDSGGGVACSGGAITSSATFTAIVDSMQAILPDIQSANVQVTYEISGVDSAATPGVVTPAVSVSVIGLTYDFLVIGAIPGLPDQITFPAFTASALAASQTL